MADRDLSGRTLGEFRLRALIGEGGYGAVYLAEQPALEREVVVKVLTDQEQKAVRTALRLRVGAWTPLAKACAMSTTACRRSWPARRQ